MLSPPPEVKARHELIFVQKARFGCIFREMKKLPFILMFFVLACQTLYAQAERPVCPRIDVVPSHERARIGSPVTFTLDIETFGKEYKLLLNWQVVSGYALGKGDPIEIVSGSGTRSITVNQVKDGTTAAVVIGGLPGDCLQMDVDTIFIDPPPEVRMVGEFRGSVSKMPSKEVDLIKKALAESPDSQLVVFVEYSAFAEQTEKDKTGRAILDSFPNRDPVLNRVSWIEVPGEGELLQFWLVPPGAEPPNFKPMGIKK